MRKIRIAVIAHYCRIGGTLTGTLNLLKALKNVVQNEQFLLVCSAGCGYQDIDLPANTEIFVYEGLHSPLSRYRFERVILPKLVGRYGPDVIFGTANVGLPNPVSPQALLMQQAYLLYDKSHYPDIHLRLRVRIAALRAQVKNSLRATDLVLCQTPVVKRRFANRFGYPESKIRILRWAPPAEIGPASADGLPSTLDNDADSLHVLLLTRFMPHRNPGTLIPLCLRYGKELRTKRVRFTTTIEPKDDPHAARFLRNISDKCLDDLIINVGSLSRADVVKYYANSHVLWLPTTLETLCLPFLEAMSIGVPILAPDLDFARYVCGDAAIFYDPWDMESMFSKILLLRDDPPLRRQLIEKGRAELGNRDKFAANWDEVAADVLRYLRLLAELS